VSNILIKVENAGAERLWSYILAYRRIMSNERRFTAKESSKTIITTGVLPELNLEQIQTVRVKKMNLKKPTST
jgi:hypothetical protein